MHIRNSLFLILISVAPTILAGEQTTSVVPELLPPLFREYGALQENPGDADSIVTLTSALQLVVAHSPQVIAAKAQIAAAKGRLQQTRYHPNPELTTQVEDFGRRNKTGPSQTSFGIEQPFELFGKRRARREVAEAELKAEAYAAQESLLQLYRTVAVTFAAALGAQENIVLAQQRLELARKIEEVVKVKVADGASAKAELLRAQSAAKLSEIDLTSAEAEATQQRLVLATLWGSDLTDYRVGGELDEWLLIPPMNTQTINLEDNPQVANLQAELLGRQAGVRLSKANGKPDISLGAGYRRLHDEGANAFLVWASVPLPLFNRNQGGVAEASALLNQTEAELATMRQQLEGQIRGFELILESQRKQISLLREQVIPPAEQALQEMDQAFRLGSQPYLSVLDAQRTLSELQGRLIGSLVEGAKTTAEIEQLIGHRLNAVRR